MSDYYGEYKVASTYQTTATGGDSTVFLYNTGQSAVGGLIQLRARNQYNATVYAQLLNQAWPTGVVPSGTTIQIATGVPTGAGSLTAVPSGLSTYLAVGQKPVAILAVPTGPGDIVLDVNTAHWVACPTGMIVAASSVAGYYQPINTGCINYTIFYKQ
jgi:hypothetical protein